MTIVTEYLLVEDFSSRKPVRWRFLDADLLIEESLKLS